MKRFIFALAAAAALLPTTHASAFCRATTCNPDKQRCEFDSKTECPLSGVPVVWANGCLTVNLQKRGASERGVSLGDAEASVQRAIDTWLSADCGNGTPSVNVTIGEPVSCDVHEYTARRNANVIMFHEDEWPYEGSEDALGVTWLTYDIDDKPGELWDVDIELNAVTEPLSVGKPKSGEVDLDSLITHEMGHLLGLAHSLEKGATMMAGYTPGSIDLRSLTADDIDGICSIYPPGNSISKSCGPRHGFSELCSREQTEPIETSDPSGGSAPKSSKGCGFAPANSNSRPELWWGALAVSLLWRARRRA